eukprot:jgi/Mesvir1/13585/Mv02813-RA.1
MRVGASEGHPGRAGVDGVSGGLRLRATPGRGAPNTDLGQYGSDADFAGSVVVKGTPSLGALNADLSPKGEGKKPTQGLGAEFSMGSRKLKGVEPRKDGGAEGGRLDVRSGTQQRPPREPQGPLVFLAIISDLGNRDLRDKARETWLRGRISAEDLGREAILHDASTGEDSGRDGMGRVAEDAGVGGGNSRAGQPGGGGMNDSTGASDHDMRPPPSPPGKPASRHRPWYKFFVTVNRDHLAAAWHDDDVANGGGYVVVRNTTGSSDAPPTGGDRNPTDAMYQDLLAEWRRHGDMVLLDRHDSPTWAGTLASLDAINLALASSTPPFVLKLHDGVSLNLTELYRTLAPLRGLRGLVLASLAKEGGGTSQPVPQPAGNGTPGGHGAVPPDAARAIGEVLKSAGARGAADGRPAGNLEGSGMGGTNPVEDSGLGDVDENGLKDPGKGNARGDAKQRDMVSPDGTTMGNHEGNRAMGSSAMGNGDDEGSEDASPSPDPLPLPLRVGDSHGNHPRSHVRHRRAWHRPHGESASGRRRGRRLLVLPSVVTQSIIQSSAVIRDDGSMSVASSRQRASSRIPRTSSYGRESDSGPYLVHGRVALARPGVHGASVDAPTPSKTGTRATASLNVRGGISARGAEAQGGPMGGGQVGDSPTLKTSATDAPDKMNPVNLQVPSGGAGARHQGRMSTVPMATAGVGVGSNPLFTFNPREGRRRLAGEADQSKEEKSAGEVGPVLAMPSLDLAAKNRKVVGFANEGMINPQGSQGQPVPSAHTQALDSLSDVTVVPGVMMPVNLTGRLTGLNRKLAHVNKSVNAVEPAPLGAGVSFPEEGAEPLLPPRLQSSTLKVCSGKFLTTVDSFVPIPFISYAPDVYVLSRDLVRCPGLRLRHWQGSPSQARYTEMGLLARVLAHCPSFLGAVREEPRLGCPDGTGLAGEATIVLQCGEIRSR